jgi:sugar/nucleoside kinase (ribokinase family)
LATDLKTPAFDYVSMGFYTFDCLAWPFSHMPEGAGTTLVDDYTLAVSGAAGTAAIAAAKMGLKTMAVAGVGQDLMGDWVLQRLAQFGVDTSMVQSQPGWRTSSSIVTTRMDGSRPAMHLKGATKDFFVADADIAKVTSTKVFHAGGVGLMEAMDKGQTAKVMRAAKANDTITTVDVFAGSPADLPAIAQVLPYSDYFMPSVEEAEALTGLKAHEDMARVFLDQGAKAVILTLGAEGAYCHAAQGQRFHMPAFDVALKCSCGCGDAFNAGIAVGLLKGFDIETTVRFAQATSALKSTGLGSQAGVESYAKTLNFMKTQKMRS